MKQNIRDAIMVMLAILITGGMAHAMSLPDASKAPVPKTTSSQHVNKPQTKHIDAPAPVPAPEVVETPAPEPEPVSEAPTAPEPAPAAPVYTGSHEEIMAAAGIAPSDYAAVDYIVSHESGWRQDAVNAGSGSCGLIQELPCGKSGCSFGDGACQLRWATRYAADRYGSWWGAQSFWVNNRWW